MIRSMTGYSEARRETADFTLAVSVKSVNHRYLDIQGHLPVGFEFLEQALRRAVKERMLRGHVEVSVSFERSGAVEVPVDRKLVSGYVKLCRQLRDEFQLGAEPDLASLLRIPGIIAPRNGQLSSEEKRRIEDALAAALSEALNSLNAMREEEGEALERDIRLRVGRLSELSKDISHLAARVSECVEKRLEQRIHDCLNGAIFDRGRLAQEVTYLVSRSDISEEVTRFQSHLNQSRKLLEAGNGVGKKLDFLFQEMNREANTMLSKTSEAPEVGLELSERAIEMKAEIEKLREQVQNIE